MAYINRMFEPELPVKPLGYWSFVTAGAPVLGVVAGGPLVESVGGAVIFAAQAPLCLVGVVVALWLPPGTERQPGVRFDVAGSITLGLGATSLLAGVNRGPRRGLGIRRGHPAVRRPGRSAGRRSCAWNALPTRWCASTGSDAVRGVPGAQPDTAALAYMGGFILAPQVLEKGLSLSTSTTGLSAIACLLTFSLIALVVVLSTIPCR